MKHGEMLRKIGLSHQDFTDYIEKSEKFNSSLNEAQTKFHSILRPPASAATAAQALSVNVTSEQLTDLLLEASSLEVVAGLVNLTQKRKPRPPKNEK